MKPNIVQAAQAFKEWRANRTKRSHTPAHLRERAVALVGHYPTQQICDLLKINSRSIKSWCKQQTPSQEFVTLTEPAAPAVAMALNGLQLKILAPGGIECHLSGEHYPASSPRPSLRRYCTLCKRRLCNDSPDCSN